jgi:hypothetical protein
MRPGLRSRWSRAKHAWRAHQPRRPQRPASASITRQHDGDRLWMRLTQRRDDLQPGAIWQGIVDQCNVNLHSGHDRSRRLDRARLRDHGHIRFVLENLAQRIAIGGEAFNEEEPDNRCRISHSSIGTKASVRAMGPHRPRSASKATSPSQMAATAQRSLTSNALMREEST